MEISWIGFIVLYLLGITSETLLKVLLNRFWMWVLSDENLKPLTTSLKLQLLVLYFDWLLKKTSVQELPKQTEIER